VDHYFSAEPEVPSSPRTVRVRLPDQEIVLRTDRGVFAAGGLDPGTAVLLSQAPPPPQGGAILDLGCGHGVIAIALSRRAPGARVLAVDVNRRARELARTNAAANGVAVEVCAPEEVDPGLRFSAIYSNPPVRVGRESLLALLMGWIRRLEPEAAAHLVVQRHLGSDSLAERLAGAGLQIRRRGSKRGYRILEVRAERPASHHA
jgi:16S rRNA (guanine1207-N2)-methyltransferase